MADWLKALTCFCKTVESGGISKAASELGVTKSMVSKQIKWLESELHTQLLDRNTRQLHSTHTGSEFYKQASLLLEQWDNMRFNLSRSQNFLQGRLVIGSTPWYAEQVLNPLLIEYLKERPHVNVSLKIFNEEIDLLSKQLDIAISAEHNIVFREGIQHVPLMPHVRLCYCASRRYIAQHGKPKTPDELHNFSLITRLNKATWEFNNKKIAVKGRYSVDVMSSALEAAASGLGIAYAIYNKDYFEKHDLVTVLDDYVLDETTFSLCYANKRYISYLMEDCIDYLTSKIGAVALV